MRRGQVADEPSPLSRAQWAAAEASFEVALGQVLKGRRYRMANERQSPGDVLDAFAPSCGHARSSEDALSRLQHRRRFVNLRPVMPYPPPEQKGSEQSQAKQRTRGRSPQAWNLADP